MDDGNVRRAEEIVVLQRLLGVRHLVAPGYAERVVELKTAFAAALQINAEIFARRGEVVAFLGAGDRRRVDRLAKAFLGLAAGDDHLPGLAVAPGRRALRGGEQAVDDRARHRLRQES